MSLFAHATGFKTRPRDSDRIASSKLSSIVRNLYLIILSLVVDVNRLYFHTCVSVTFLLGAIPLPVMTCLNEPTNGTLDYIPTIIIKEQFARSRRSRAKSAHDLALGSFRSHSFWWFSTSGSVICQTTFAFATSHLAQGKRTNLRRERIE